MPLVVDQLIEALDRKHRLRELAVKIYNNASDWRTPIAKAVVDLCDGGRIPVQARRNLLVFFIQDVASKEEVDAVLNGCASENPSGDPATTE